MTLVVAEQAHRRIPSFDRLASGRRVAELAGSIRATCPAFLFAPQASFHPDDPDWRLQLDAMWAGLSAGVPTLNGYSGMLPPGWDLGGSRITSPESRSALEARVARWTSSRQVADLPVCVISPAGLPPR